jgi:hypothetical protein
MGVGLSHELTGCQAWLSWRRYAMVSKQKEKFENIGITWSFQRRRFKHTDATDRIHLDFPNKLTSSAPRLARTKRGARGRSYKYLWRLAPPSTVFPEIAPGRCFKPARPPRAFAPPGPPRCWCICGMVWLFFCSLAVVCVNSCS